MAKVENNETKTIYKCAICGKEHSTIPERANCEQECYKKLEIERKQALEEKKKKEQEGRRAELDAALKYAYDLYQNYVEDYGSYNIKINGDSITPFAKTFFRPFLEDFWM